jgi:hypothetical protein
LKATKVGKMESETKDLIGLEKVKDLFRKEAIKIMNISILFNYRIHKLKLREGSKADELRNKYAGEWSEFVDRLLMIDSAIQYETAEDLRKLAKIREATNELSS